MALHREVEVSGGHAHPVILDQDAADPAVFERDGDAGRAGIQRVLHQLLHGRGRPFHHLAGGDAVGGGLRQQANQRRGHGPDMRFRALRGKGHASGPGPPSRTPPGQARG